MPELLPFAGVAIVAVVTIAWAVCFACFTYAYSERGRRKGDRAYIEREVAAKRAREAAGVDHPA